MYTFKLRTSVIEPICKKSYAEFHENLSPWLVAGTRAQREELTGGWTWLKKQNFTFYFVRNAKTEMYFVLYIPVRRLTVFVVVKQGDLSRNSIPFVNVIFREIMLS